MPVGAEREEPVHLPAPDPNKPFVEQLFEAGVHFGHRAARWNPKMSRYVFAKKNKNHLIDVKETLRGLLIAEYFVERLSERGGEILAVGTKRQAKQIVGNQAREVGMHWVNERWLGGALTNHRTIRSRLKRLEELEALHASGEIEGYSKKMQMRLRREKNKITRNLAGIRNMERLPAAVFVVGVNRETNALREAASLGIPTLGIIDTDSDPDLVDICIPANDDAYRAIELLFARIARAFARGREKYLATVAARAKQAPKPPTRRAAPREGAPAAPDGRPVAPPEPAPAPRRGPVRKVVIPTPEPEDSATPATTPVAPPAAVAPTVAAPTPAADAAPAGGASDAPASR